MVKEKSKMPKANGKGCNAGSSEQIEQRPESCKEEEQQRQKEEEQTGWWHKVAHIKSKKKGEVTSDGLVDCDTNLQPATRTVQPRLNPSGGCV